MKLDETQILLEKARVQDSRIVLTTQLIQDWQHALIHHSFEACFDAMFDHFEHCGPRVAFVPAEVLHHIRKAREALEEKQRRDRERDRNETLFGELADHRTDAQREASMAAMRAGRAHLDAVLEQRRPVAILDGDPK